MILRLFFRRPPPDRWPSNLSSNQLVAWTRGYLKSSGWALLAPWPWVKAWVRASRDGIVLNLVVADLETLSMATVISDVRQDSQTMGATIGILSFAKFDPELADTAAASGIFLLNPSDLPIVGQHIYTAEQRKQKVGSGNVQSASESPVGTKLEKSSPGQAVIKGIVEASSDTTLWGWAFDTTQPTIHLFIRARQGDEVVGRCTAAKYRLDLLKSGFGNGDHAFELAFAPRDSEPNVIVVEASTNGVDWQELLWRRP